MIFPLLPKLRTTPRSLTQTTTTSDAVSNSLTSTTLEGSSLASHKRRVRHKRNAHGGVVKSGVVFLLLGAAAFLPANLATAQTPQQDYLRQQAAALKAQMVRAQVEQAADPGFAQKAYEAQQKYLQETAEKSFRIGKPQTVKAQLVTGQAQSYQAQPAMPPVHVAPTRHSVPPQRVAYAPPQPTYAAPRQHTPTQQAFPEPARQARPIASLPNPIEYGDQGESISSPANRVGLQDRLTSFLTKPKHDTSKLPLPQFDVATQPQVPSRAPTLAPRRTATEQPMFAPEPRVSSVAKLPKPKINQVDEAAYQRMATAIAEREVDRAIAFEKEQPSNEIVQTSTLEPTQQISVFSAPPIQKQSSVPSFNGVRANETAIESAKSVVTKQVSVLSRAPQQGSDSRPFGVDSTDAPDRLRLQRNELPRPDEDSRLGPLRRPEPAQIDEEIKTLEQRRKELEEETERRDTKRRQRELEQEERGSRARPRRDDDLQGEVRDGDNRPIRLSCEEHRRNLLNSSIREISMDISPRASRIRDQYIAISRSWTDRLGNVIATGSMADLRRGYVIIDGINGRQKIPYSKLSDADWAAVSEYWQIPELCSIGDNRLPQRNWVPQSFTWTASSLCHKPLYFENQQLERYGHTHGPVLQPIHSAAHFFVSLATLPYATAIHPPNECRYALGYYRPGNCAPWLKDPIPVSLDGLKRQALVTTGLSFVP